MKITFSLKKIINSIWNEFVCGGHLISLGAVGITFTSSVLINIRISWEFLVIIYLLSFTSLLYNRYIEREVDFLTNPQRTKVLEKYFHYINLIIIFSVIVFLLIFLYSRKIITPLFIIFFFLISFLYTKYLKSITNKIVAFKNICFAFTTGLLVIFLSIYYSYPLLSAPLFLIFLFVFLRMFANTIFLDIKDVESDTRGTLLTLPLVLGREKTMKALQVITILSVMPIFLAFYLRIIPTFSLMLVFVVPYAFYYFNKSRLGENFYLVNYVLADFEFILWPISVLLGKTIINII